ncbi:MULTISPECIES: L-lactate dehydrogenase (quinone) large subunit LdhH [Thermodesulfovibrio]|jgi:iron-sulfur cluster protein|uniref:L-lactate dehydrogenase (quinone) large subunit LdhH n=1 Tax=Thermodesulfovibrio TaxID=28261 RepID=UPI002606992C|nr:LUD domain-containing protein [Thermodesulfovibrio sp.]
MIKEEIKKALQNANLGGALTRFSEAYAVSRARAYEGLNFEELREKIARAKAYVAENLEEIVQTFIRSAEKNGAKVFYTKSPEEVRKYIIELAKKHNVKSIVKSKSMATEEIHLNKYLKDEGIEVNETDLGEWIIQLAGQRPSHMVLPAIHLTRYDVSEVFTKKVEPIEPDIARMVKFARKHLRRKFLAADMGISGANIAIAETGTIVLFTNEGNARLTMTLPKIHVAVVGVEKLVARFEDIFPIIRALPRSATAQLITSYISFVSKPYTHIDGSQKDFHIVLLDNNRSSIAKDPVFKQTLQCIRCASCLNVCPVFRHIGGHVFGKVYTGGIGTILTAWTEGLKASKDIQGLCIQCGNCVRVCPGKIDIPELILEIRKRLAKEEGLSFKTKAIYSVVNNRKLFHSILRAASKIQKPFEKGGFIRHLPFFLSELTAERSLPAIADIPFRDRFKKIRQPKSQKKAIFFAGCLIDFAYPEIGEALVKLLNAAGIEVLFPEEQTCCGAPARYSGVMDVAANNSRQNVEALISIDADYIVSACPTCTVALKTQFIKDLKEQNYGEEIIRKAQKLSEKVKDASELINSLIKEGNIKFKDGKEQVFTYHDPCHLVRTLNIQKEPRESLLASGMKITEMFESDTCCGMGGSYSLKFPEISGTILKRKLENIKKTQVSLVCTDCPGCVMQIRGGVDREGLNIEVKHSIEVLAERMD